MKTYTFQQIKKANELDKSDRTDCSTPADIYVSQHLNGYTRRGSKQNAVDFLVKKGLLK